MSKYRITLEGKTYEMEIELVQDEAIPQTVKKQEYKEFRTTKKDSNVDIVDSSVQKKTENHPGVVTAPMPGTVLRIEKSEGTAVKEGDLVLVLEAMKMENEIFAPVDGTIVTMNCKASGTVASGEALFEVK